MISRWKRSLSDPFDAARRRAATASGAVSLGLVAILFAMLGDEAQKHFTAMLRVQPYLPLVITPLGFAVVAWLTNRVAPSARGSGIPQVIAAGKAPDIAYGRLLSLPTALLKLGFTVLILLVGGSVGREGPTVQVSAAIMILWHRVFRVPMTSGVLIAGGAAGVAAAFNTPLAGVAFAIEELAAAFEQRVALLVMGAVVVSGLVSLGIAGDYVYFGVMHETLSVGSVVLIAPVAGIIGGAVGGAFSRIMLAASRGGFAWYDQFRTRPVLLAFVCGLVVAVIGIATGGLTWGTGYETTRDLIEGTGDASGWFGPAKFAATLATALSGVPGGIFAPSLAVGAGLGELLSFAFPDDPMAAVVLLGMTGYFVGVVRAPLTAVIILMETTASRGMILPLFATALIADGVSKVVCREKLYHGLARGFLAPRKTAARTPGGEAVEPAAGPSTAPPPLPDDDKT
ncbi:chloride channel protein [Novosphingobium sp. PC22D]|uniref:chloride channel protein n=1 Tax=Novosphingobium sp. PC22D TaxID=1962403 RepID=UPI001F0A8125|nr:chloride channel protein [Novosphingobium sp. PC22D]